MKTGLYEQVISVSLGEKLENLKERYLSFTEEVDEGEAAGVLARYVTDLLRDEFERISEENSDLSAMVIAANRVIAVVESLSGEAGLQIREGAQQLMALYLKENRIAPPRPETSIAQTSLFTGAPREPSLYTELKKEIATSDGIDLLISFIKWSGLRLLIEDLRAFALQGGSIRVITTSYIGATEIKAIDELSHLPNAQIRVSYDAEHTRLHAKAYIFRRETGFSTAYVGSSNLSNPAMSAGLEWNVKVTQHDQKDTMQKIMATFDSYWHSTDFEDYDETQRDRLRSALRQGKVGADTKEISYLFDIAPYPFQQEILDSLEAERKVRGHCRNLVIAATGTGKTVISAFDYKRFCAENVHSSNRLLFVAHREEILRQSLGCFRGVLRDHNFGDLFVGTERPEQTEHLFMSIQTFNSREWHRHTSYEYYDFVIVDEFHHAAAPSYRALLEHYRPKVLLGLTATPERMDGKDILEFFDGRISAELRLPEAIDRKLLSPFQYFGVTDTVDLKDVRWTRGGYDRTELSNIYTMNRNVAERRTDHIVQSLDKYSSDMEALCALGFCVSVEHAKYMAEAFTQRGIPAMALHGETGQEERKSAARKLVKGDIKVIFAVDIYNEGVDIPEINTVLFLRPTESLTIFLQQLGRGLRLSEGKDCLTVLDFIGQANKRYSFEEKFAALLNHSGKSVVQEIEKGFPSLPKGCYIVLEKVARKSILDNIRASFSYRAGMAEQIRAYAEDVLEGDRDKLTLEGFLLYHHMDSRKLYHWDSFSRLCVEAGVYDDFEEPLEEVLRGAYSRLCSIDSRRWLTFLISILKGAGSDDDLSAVQERMLRMFIWSVWQKQYNEVGFAQPMDAVRALRMSPVLCRELVELLSYNYSRIDFVDATVDLGFESPLDLHCSYSRDQIFAALDLPNPMSVREGVRYLPEKKLDVFLITLNKSDKEYSPTTMYHDYSVNENLFHWQSQSTTAEKSRTGQRYIHHNQMDIKTLLFVRENKKDFSGALPYTFLGKADYVQHEGEKPMSILYRLHRPIPAKYLKKTNQLMS